LLLKALNGWLIVISAFTLAVSVAQILCPCSNALLLLALAGRLPV
jgi:hypothetical protein